MSVIAGPNPYRQGTEEWIARQAFIYDPLSESRCFLCSGALDGFPIVQWSSPSADVFLHPPCAARLSVHLASDSLRAEKGWPNPGTTW